MWHHDVLHSPPILSDYEASPEHTFAALPLSGTEIVAARERTQSWTARRMNKYCFEEDALAPEEYVEPNSTATP